MYVFHHVFIAALNCLPYNNFSTDYHYMFNVQYNKKPQRVNVFLASVKK